MPSIETKNLSQKDIYFLLTAAIVPRPIAFVSTISKTGVHNLAPFSFFNAMGSNPPIIVFSPASTGDQERPFKDTYNNLLETGDCVVQLVTEDIAERMLICSQNFAASEDEFTLSGLTAIAADLVKSPRVQESKFQMECKLLEMKSYGEQIGAANIAICEVLKFHIDESILEPDSLTKIDYTKFPIIGRLGRHDYLRVHSDEIFQMKMN